MIFQDSYTAQPFSLSINSQNKKMIVEYERFRLSLYTMKNTSKKNQCVEIVTGPLPVLTLNILPCLYYFGVYRKAVLRFKGPDQV